MTVRDRDLEPALRGDAGELAAEVFALVKFGRFLRGLTEVEKNALARAFARLTVPVPPEAITIPSSAAAKVPENNESG